MAHCTECGTEAPDTAKFCPACGREIQFNEPESSKGENIIHEVLGNVPDSPRPPSHAPLIWGGATFLILLVLLIVVFAGGSSNTDTSSSSDSTSSSNNLGDNGPTLIKGSEIAQLLSSSLKKDVNQKDSFQATVWQGLPSDVEFWSTAYLSVLVFSSSDDDQQYENQIINDIRGSNLGYAYTSCFNVTVAYSAYQNIEPAVLDALGHYCYFPYQARGVAASINSQSDAATYLEGGSSSYGQNIGSDVQGLESLFNPVGVADMQLTPDMTFFQAIETIYPRFIKDSQPITGLVDPTDFWSQNGKINLDAEIKSYFADSVYSDARDAILYIAAMDQLNQVTYQTRLQQNPNYSLP